jgi:carbon storage regulator
MLVLSRRIGEQIVIGTDIQITVVRVEGSKVKLGISAPLRVGVRREEVQEDHAANSLQSNARTSKVRRHREC